MVAYKLTYFDLPRRGESTRLILALAGQHFEDVRIPWMGEEWKTLKPKTPFGSLPTLEVDGQVYCQSFPINRFLANRFGLAGRSDLEKAQVDMTAECVEDFVESTLRPINKETDEEKRASLRAELAEPMMKSLGLLEKMLIANNGGDGFFVGDSVTWADLVFLVRVDEYIGRVGMEVDWTKVPKLAKLRDRVASLPRVLAWRKDKTIIAPKYKLTYFDVKGRAEVSRLLFALADQKFEDVRVNHEEFGKIKPSLPFGQLPILEIDGVVICQSRTCHRFLARRFGFAGKNELESLQCDMLSDCMNDFINRSLIPILSTKDAEKKENMRKRVEATDIPAYLTKMEGFLYSNNGGNGYFVGDGLTWADVSFYNLSDLSEIGITIDWSVTPKLKTLVDKVAGEPRIKTWNKTHKEKLSGQ